MGVKWTINFSVTRQTLTRTDTAKVVADSKNYLFAAFSFSDEWDGLNKVAQFTRRGVTYNVDIVDDEEADDVRGECQVPWEAIDGEGAFEVNVFAGDLATVNSYVVTVYASGLKEGQLPSEPTPGYFDSLIASAEAAVQAAAVAAQALQDLLNMLGTSVATLGQDGKLTAGQIPAIAITTINYADSEAEMLALTAEPGEVCIRRDINKTYFLRGSDPSVLESWAPMLTPTNWADEAGHASTADTATSATLLNGKRIINMTQSQYDAAVLEDNTYYFVVPDEV